MKQKAAHTPGPWRAEKPEWMDHPIVMRGDGGVVAKMIDRPTAEADSRLIAAAPELLEALQTTAANLRSWKAANGGGIKTFDSWLEVVEEAIAKAEGGAQ